MADTQEEAQKQLVISHMNGDHQESLAFFLEVYCRIHPARASAARMEDVGLSDMILNHNGTRYRVPFDHPMKSFSEVKHHLVEMHKYCLQKLGLSDIIVTEYRAPEVPHAVFDIFILSLCAVFSRRSNFLPGSMLYSVALDGMPKFATFCYRVQPIFIPTLFGIHFFEACHLAVTKLRRHRVPVLSTPWLMWMISTFLEGIPALQRFNAMVREEKTKRNKT